MRFHVLAADYDGTLATHGELDDATLEALRRLRASGRKIVMVTGRELDDLSALLAEPTIFDRIVAENGAVLYDPATREARNIVEPPPRAYAAELRRRGVDAVREGRVIVATWEPHQLVALDVIRDLGLELSVIFNKGAVMVLPTGVNKATGLVAALTELGLSPHNAVAVGDAENDHAMLELAECGVAVANGLLALKRHADLVTERAHGAGVAELIDRILANDLDDLALARRRARFGKRGDRELDFDPYATTILACGSPGSGKSTLTTAIVENLARAGYQVALIDPEGNHTALPIAVALGSPARAPLVEEALEVLRDPNEHVAINLLAVPLADRPAVAATFLAALLELHRRTGHPHRIVIDEAHRMLPVAPPRRHGMLYVTVHPERMAPAVLATVDLAVATGEDPLGRLAGLARAVGREPPAGPAIDKLEPGHAIVWHTAEPTAVEFEAARPKGELRRHARKSTTG